MKIRTWLVTGATGFIGTYLIKQLAASGDRIFALARAQVPRNELPTNVVWIEGDIEQSKIIYKSDREDILFQVTDVLHLAALYDVKASHSALYLANVIGTRNLLNLCENMPQLATFHFASTVAIAGDFKGTMTEEMFEVGQEFSDSYASTKFAAEKSVREWTFPVGRVIHRLGIVVGDSKTGEIVKHDGPYYLLNALKKYRDLIARFGQFGYIPLPFDEYCQLYCIPVDVLCGAMCSLARIEHKKGLHTFHLTGDASGIPIQTLIRALFEAAQLKPRFYPVGNHRWVKAASNALKIPEQTISYMQARVTFDNLRFRQVLPNFEFPKFENYAPIVFGQKLLERKS